MTVHRLSPPARRGRRSVRIAIVAALAAVAVVASLVLVITSFGQYETLIAARHHIPTAKPWLVLLQFAGIAALWLAWPSLVGRRCARWPEEARAALLAARHRICIGLLLIELVVVLGIPFRFL